MKFTHLRVVRFGPLADLDTGEGRPLPGLVVVHGPNEAGKSAFHAALTALLHGFYPASREQNPYSPWSGGDIELHGAFVLADGRAGTVHRRLLSTPKGHLVLDEEMISLDNRSLPVAEHLTPKIYGQVYGIDLADLQGVREESWNAVRDHLVVGMGSDDLRAPREAAAALQAEASGLWRSDRRGKSRHRSLDEEARELRRQRDAALDRDRRQRESLGRARSLERSIETLRSERGVLLEGIERIRELAPLRARVLRMEGLEGQVGDARELEPLPLDPENRLRELTARVASARARKEAIARIDARIQEAAEAVGVADPAAHDLAERLATVPTEDLRAQIAEIEEESARTRALGERIEELERQAPPEPVRPTPWSGFLALLGLGLLLVAGLRTDGLLALLGGAILATGGTILARRLSQAARARGRREAHEAEVRALGSRRANADRERARQEAALRDRLAAAGIDRWPDPGSLGRLPTAIERLLELRREREEAPRPALEEAEADLASFVAALRTAGGGPDEEGLQAVRARIEAFQEWRHVKAELERETGDVAALRHRIREAERTGEVWRELPLRLAEQEGALAELDERLLRAREERARLLKDAEPRPDEATVDRIDGRLEEIREEMREAEIERDRRFVLARLVERAETRFRESHQPELLRRAGRHLARITEGRYGRILTGEADDPQALHLLADHLPEPAKVDQPLSTGTREQVYFALRLAIVDHLDEGRDRLPLLLDEVLVNWDPARRARVLDLLEEVARERQVFLFTCHPHLAEEVRERGGRVLDLDAPGSNREG